MYIVIIYFINLDIYLFDWPKIVKLCCIHWVILLWQLCYNCRCSFLYYCKSSSVTDQNLTKCRIKAINSTTFTTTKGTGNTMSLTIATLGSQFWLQLQQIIFNKSSGTEGGGEMSFFRNKSAVMSFTKTRVPFFNCHPQSVDSRFLPIHCSCISWLTRKIW